ncbi:MAG: TIGR03749 family integrating conjugative element protein [Gammaproteobacteria bacterium]|nr:TIGR03749 family integrating conjugative element protein [Gammaproteobacteria bacterium]
MPDLRFLSPGIWLTAVLWCLSTAIHAGADISPHDSPERIVWRKVPIELSLVVGEERLVHFPDSVRAGLPRSLTAVLQAQSIHGTLYLHARQPFSSTRIMVHTQPEGPIYVLDIEAVVADTNTRTPPDVQVVPDLQAAHPEVDNEAGGHSSPWGYVALTRFAAQRLYAPQRLVPVHSGVVAVPVDPEPVDLVRNRKVRAVPVAAWKAGPYHVTAVQLSNLGYRTLILDPRGLQGAWLAATFQHNRLQPKGGEADTTAVYLVSDRPVDAALRERTGIRHVDVHP